MADEDRPIENRPTINSEQYYTLLRFLPTFALSGNERGTGEDDKGFRNLANLLLRDYDSNQTENFDKFYERFLTIMERDPEHVNNIIGETGKLRYIFDPNIDQDSIESRIENHYRPLMERDDEDERVLPPELGGRDDQVVKPVTDIKDYKDFKANLTKKELLNRTYYQNLLNRGIEPVREFVDLTKTDPEKKIEFVGYDDGYDDALTAAGRRRLSRMTPHDQYKFKKKVLLDQYLKPELDKEVPDVDVASMLAGDEKGLDLYHKYVLMKKREDARRKQHDPFYRTDYTQPYLTAAKIKRAKEAEAWQKANIEKKLYKTLLERPDHQALDSFEQVMTFLIKTAKDDLLYLNKIKQDPDLISEPDDKIRAKIKEQVLREKLDTYIRFVNDTNFSDIKHVTNPMMLYKFAVTKKMLPIIYEALSAKINAKYQYDIIQANYKKIMDGIYFKPKLYMTLYKTITHLFKDIESRIVIVSRIVHEVERSLTPQQISKMLFRAGLYLMSFLKYWAKKRKLFNESALVEYDRISRLPTDALMREFVLKSYRKIHEPELEKAESHSKDSFIEIVHKYIGTVDHNDPQVDYEKVRELKERYKRNVTRTYNHIMGLTREMLEYRTNAIPDMAKDGVLHKDPAIILMVDFIIFQELKEGIKRRIPFFAALDHARRRIVKQPFKLYLRKIPVSLVMMMITYTTFYPLIDTIVKYDVIPYMKKTLGDVEYKSVVKRLLNNLNMIKGKDGIKRAIKRKYENMVDATLRRLSQHPKVLEEIPIHVRGVFYKKKKEKTQAQQELETLGSMKDDPKAKALYRLEKKITSVMDQVKLNSKKLKVKKPRRRKKRTKKYPALKASLKRAKKLKLKRGSIAKYQNRDSQGKFIKGFKTRQYDYNPKDSHYYDPDEDKYRIDKNVFDKEEDALAKVPEKYDPTREQDYDEDEETPEEVEFE